MAEELLSRSFFTRPAPELARDLLGRILVSDIGDRRIVGRISEIEAYRQDDPASHSFRGMTPRNRAMFLEGGHLYVYLIYGMHHCANIIAGEEGSGEAVLIRGIIPREGIETVRERRGMIVRDRDLTNGPGKVAQALAIGPQHNGIDLLQPDSPIRVLKGEPVEDRFVLQTGRIGITKGTELPWRWLLVP